MITATIPGRTPYVRGSHTATEVGGTSLLLVTGLTPEQVKDKQAELTAAGWDVTVHATDAAATAAWNAKRDALYGRKHYGAGSVVTDWDGRPLPRPARVRQAKDLRAGDMYFGPEGEMVITSAHSHSITRVIVSRPRRIRDIDGVSTVHLGHELLCRVPEDTFYPRFES